MSRGGGPGGWGLKAGTSFARGLSYGLKELDIDRVLGDMQSRLTIEPIVTREAAQRVSGLRRGSLDVFAADQASRVIGDDRRGHGGQNQLPPVTLAPVYAPILSTATPGELTKAARTLADTLGREMMSRGLIPRTQTI